MRIHSTTFAVSACLAAFAATALADSPPPICVCDAIGYDPIQNPTTLCECPFLKGSPFISNEQCCDPLGDTRLGDTFFGFFARIILSILSFFSFGGPVRRSLADLDVELGTYQVRPDLEPTYEGAIILDGDVGIWKLPNFLNDDEIQAMNEAAKAADAHSYDCKLHYCLRRPYVENCQINPDYESHVQPAGKKCMMLTENIVEMFNESDQSIVSALNVKSKSVWPNYASSNPLVYQKTLSDTGSFQFHVDGLDLYQDMDIVAPVTTIIYLSDGGSRLVFPRANNGEGLLITPKAGMAVTFFNIDDQGVPNMKAVHGVEPTHAKSDPRMMIQDKFVYAPELHATWGYKAEELRLSKEL